jgi:heavy metal sensor kinase
MSSATGRPLGLRTRLMLWWGLVLAATMAAGFLWVHFGLVRVLESRNDAFLERKAAELLAVVREERPGGREELAAEIGREVMAYEPEGLIVVVREPARVSHAPKTPAAELLASKSAPLRSPHTIELPGVPSRFRVLTASSASAGLSLELGMSLAETDETIAAFDRQIAGGALAVLILAAAGGVLLSRQALRPVAQSIRSARRLDAKNLSERLPRTGAGDELDELAATINGLLDRLAAFHAQASRFTADASHELRSPLGAIRAAIEMALQRPRTPEEYQEILCTLSGQCERLTGLVNGLLLLARSDAGEIAITRESLDLAALVRDVVEMFEPVADDRGLCLVAEAARPLMIEGDPSRLRQLVTNLLDNAIRFTEPGGSITVRLEGNDASAALCVTDTGIGIPPEHLPHVFERFYQVDPARASVGCGLGLSICKWIASAHGGTIQAASGKTGGTEMTVVLPKGPELHTHHGAVLTSSVQSANLN